MAATFADGHEWPVHDFPELPQSGHLIPVECVGAVLRSFDPLDVKSLGAGGIDVKSGPARHPGFLGTKAMPIYESEQNDIPERVPTTPAGGGD
jgi:hypothetical protein